MYTDSDSESCSDRGGRRGQGCWRCGHSNHAIRRWTRVFREDSDFLELTVDMAALPRRCSALVQLSVMRNGAQTRRVRTAVVDDAQAPRWSFRIQLPELSGSETLVLSVVEPATFVADRCLGQAAVAVATVLAGRETREMPLALGPMQHAVLGAEGEPTSTTMTQHDEHALEAGLHKLHVTVQRGGALARGYCKLLMNGLVAQGRDGTAHGSSGSGPARPLFVWMTPTLSHLQWGTSPYAAAHTQVGVRRLVHVATTEADTGLRVYMEGQQAPALTLAGLAPVEAQALAAALAWVVSKKYWLPIDLWIQQQEKMYRLATRYLMPGQRAVEARAFDRLRRAVADTRRHEALRAAAKRIFRVTKQVGPRYKLRLALWQLRDNARSQVVVRRDDSGGGIPPWAAALFVALVAIVVLALDARYRGGSSRRSVEIVG